ALTGELHTVASASPAPSGSGHWIARPVPGGRRADLMLPLESGAPDPALRLVPAHRMTWRQQENVAGEPGDEGTYLPSAEDAVFPLPADAAWRLRLLEALGRA